MKILVTALYVAGDVNEGGSSFFMKCIIDNLREMGHTVVAAANLPHQKNDPTYMSVIRDKYDLIICSHREILVQLVNNPAPKVCISQGLVGPETFVKGADLYYSISEEAMLNNLDNFGVASQVISQPVNIPKQVTPVNKVLRNILIIRRYPVTDDPFLALSKKYNVRISDKSIPISQQIEWADLCITLGRGAVEAMAMGRTVLVADKRPYMEGAYGDGYLNSESIDEIARCNFSGRRFKHTPTLEWLMSELAKYNPRDAKFCRRYVTVNSEAQKVICRILKDAYPLVKKNDPELSSFHDFLIYKFPEGSTVFELGSGPGTARLAEYFKMYSVEHNPEWLWYAEKSNYIYAPIEDGWYEVASIKEKRPTSYDALLVDGPTGAIGRGKMLENLDLFDLSTTLIFDDVNRPEEMEIFNKVLEKVPGREWRTFKGPLKDYAVILKKGETFA